MPNTLWVLDVDGTVANNSHREGLIKCSSPDWDAFHSAALMSKDVPIQSASFHFASGVFKTWAICVPHSPSGVYT